MIHNCTFNGTYSFGQGSVLSAEQGAEVEISHSYFKYNYAFYGGVLAGREGSIVTIKNSTLYSNFAMQGGVAFFSMDS